MRRPHVETLAAALLLAAGSRLSRAQVLGEGPASAVETAPAAPLPALTALKGLDGRLAPAASPGALPALSPLPVLGMGPPAAEGRPAALERPGGGLRVQPRGAGKPAEERSGAGAELRAAARAAGPGGGSEGPVRAGPGGLFDGSRPLNVLLAASEAVPFVKTGGLADVVDALGKGLVRAGHRAALVLPKYKDARLDGHSVEALPGAVQVRMGDRVESARVLKTASGGVDVYLIEHDGYFGREGVYSSAYGDHPDNDERFLFFSRAALEAARLAGFRPDIVHVHDWPTGLVPALLKSAYAADPFFAGTASVFSIHNLAYKGLFAPETLEKAGLDARPLAPSDFLLDGRVSFLKTALLHADKLVTVSRRYAEETRRSPEFGYGLEGLLDSRGPDYTGILNGVDLESWDPSRDPRLPIRYGLQDALKGKAANKRAFQESHGLDVHPRAPLIGVVSRIASQKGLDLVADIAPALIKMGAQLAVLGSAHPQDGEGLEVERRLKELADRHPGSVFAHPFDLDLPSAVFAASDFYLMPSRFEPCGLSQQFAMLYGSIPIVTPVGGLADTVFDRPGEPGSSGFHVGEFTAPGLMKAVVRALAAYRRPGMMERLVQTAMSRDASWDASIAEYLEVYREALDKIRWKSSGGSARSERREPPGESSSSS